MASCFRINVSISYVVLYVFLVSYTIFLSSNMVVAAVAGQTFHTIQVSSFLPSSVCSPSTIDHSKIGSLKVVHRHGPCSQLNQDQATAPTMTEILFHDQSRVESIQARLGFSKARNSFKGSRATIPDKSGSSFGSANYVVKVGLGTPKKDLSLMFDTGSGFTWTQCAPCVKCYQQQEPTFNPSSSKSYRNITCKSPQCSKVAAATGSEPDCDANACFYGIQYGDGSISIGFLGSDKLTLTPSDVFPNFSFGCGKYNDGLFRGVAGLLGLDRGPLSTLTQTAFKYGKYFSYCLPSTSSATGTLTFGKGGTKNPNLKFTPFEANPKGQAFYFVSIIGIKVGGVKLAISESVFKAPGTLIDSGTVITRLQPAAYAGLRASFREIMKKNYNMTKGVSIFDTCYDFSGYDVFAFPTISFLFAGNVEVPVPPSGILVDVGSSEFCLAFAGNRDASTVGIFGNTQQQTLDVVYDVAGGKIGFGTDGCS